MSGDTPPAKEARQTTSPLKTDIEKCSVCLEPATEGDIIECNCCETLHHCSCLKISSNQCKVLSSIVNNVVFLCNECLQRLPTTFECYVSCVQSEPRLSSIESKLSELQSAENSLSDTIKKIEAQLTDWLSWCIMDFYLLSATFQHLCCKALINK